MKWIKRISVATMSIAILLVAVLSHIPQGYVYRAMVRYDLFNHATAQTSSLTGYTGDVGKEDIEWGNGLATDTYTVPSHTSGTITLTRVPSLFANIASLLKGKWYVSSDSSIADHSNASVAGSIAWVLAQIGTTDLRTIEVPPGSYAIAANTNWSTYDNVFFDVQAGALFVTDGFTLTIPNAPIAGDYQIFDAGTGEVLIAKGARLINWWGTDSDAMESSCTSATSNFILTATPGQTYTVTASAVCNVDDHVTLELTGATFNGTYNGGPWWNLNDDEDEADPPGRPTELHVVGGNFEYTGGGTATVASAIRIDGARQSSISRAQFLYFEKAIESDRFESLEIGPENRFYYNDYAFYQPLAAAGLNSQNLWFHNNTCVAASATAMKACVSQNDVVRDTRIENNTIAGPFSEAAFYGVDSDYDAGVSNMLTYNYVVKGNHHENMQGPAVKLYHSGNDVGFKQITITDNTYRNSQAETFSILDLDYIRSGIIERNDVNMLAASTVTYVDLDVNTTGISLDFTEGLITNVDTVLTALCDRDAVRIRPLTVMTGSAYGPGTGSVTGFDGVVTYSTSTGTIDMSAAWSGWAGAYLPPTGYWLKIDLEDSGSFASVARIILRSEVGADADYDCDINIRGVIDSRREQRMCYVDADANGDIYYSITASGVDTLIPKIMVMGWQNGQTN